MGMSLAQRPEADALLDEDPLALLIGMLLDQQVPMERAFTGPYEISRRLGRLDVAAIASADPEELAAVFAEPPAVHRFPSSMAARTQALCRYLVDRYEGDVSRLWSDAPDGRELLKRLSDLPGFGKQTAQIFLALLGKQRGVQPDGWREAAGPYGEDGVHRSVADIVDAESLAAVRAYKQEQKAAAKAGAADKSGGTAKGRAAAKSGAAVKGGTGRARSTP
jgi:uncharacterized HhH-GPD family protein